MVATSEAPIQKACLEWLNTLRGVKAYRNAKGGIRKSGRVIFMGIKAPGSSDIFVNFKGRFLVVEVKRPGEKPSKDQDDFIAETEAQGGVGLWCDSVEGLELKMRERGLI